MGLPGVFEVFALSIGPSSVYTAGALKIGQTFREVLLASPYRPNHRILIELCGDFSKSGRENNSDQAVVAGLGGFTLEQTSVHLTTFYDKIKEHGYLVFRGDFWPFNPESDLVFNASDKKSGYQNCIRFHLLSMEGQPVFQADYSPVGNGLIRGPGLAEIPMTQPEGQLRSFKEIRDIIHAEKLSIPEYVISGECSRYKISREHFQRRMLATWKLMVSHIDRGLKAQDLKNEHPQNSTDILSFSHPSLWSVNPSAGGDSSRASMYARALAGEILKNRPVITSPTSTGSAIVPAVFRHLQEKFLFSDEKMVEGLTVCGLLGSLLLNFINESVHPVGMQTEIACSAIMTSAGVAYLMGGTISEIEKAATMATLLYGRPNPADNPFETKSIILLNSIFAQTLPALVDLSRIQSGTMIPDFDEAASALFCR